MTLGLPWERVLVVQANHRDRCFRQVGGGLEVAWSLFSFSVSSPPSKRERVPVRPLATLVDSSDWMYKFLGQKNCIVEFSVPA